MDSQISTVLDKLTGISIAAQELCRYITRYRNFRQALLAWETPWITALLIVEYHQCLTETAQRNVNILRWIKGHGNYNGNPIADILVKKFASFLQH